jgi:hypothetical protein
MPRCSLGLGLSPSIGAAVASGDFTNIATANAADGVYTLNGASAELGDIVDLASPDTNLDPLVDIDADGIKPKDLGGGNSQGIGFALGNPLLTQALASGFTALFDFSGNGEGATVSVAVSDGDGNNLAEASMGTTGMGMSYLSANTGEDELQWSANPGWGEAQDNQINRVALSFSDAHISASINGGPARRLDAPGIEPLYTKIVFGTGSMLSMRLRSFAFYEPVDDADLPGLSSL